MIVRRTVFALLAATAAATALIDPTAALSQDWKRDFPELRFSVRPNENAEGMSRWAELAGYLENALGVKVVLRQASDYAGTIEALKSKRLDAALLGSSGYAQAWLVTNGNVEPIAAVKGPDGDTGYHSMILVRADSPYRTIDDLKGKKLAFADPNSTSGYQVPSFFLRKEGREPKTFFAQTGFAGTHENAVMSVMNGTYDAAACWYTTAERTNITRMESKGMIPKGSTRLVWLSPQIQGDAFVVRKDLPASLRSAIQQALVTVSRENPQLLKRLGDGSWRDIVPINHSAYIATIEMVQDNLAQRKK